MNSQEYWYKREYENHLNRKKRDKNNQKEIDKILDGYMSEVQKEINAEWAKYANKNGLTIEESMKKADKMDVKDFEKTAKRMVKDKDFSKEANDLLQTYNMKMRVNRLELIKARVGLQTTALGDELNKAMREQAIQATIAELERQAGILGNSLNDKQDYRALAERMIDSSVRVQGIPNGSSTQAIFSKGIWGSVSMLQSDLEKTITSVMIQGRNPKNYVRQYADAFNSTRYQAYRLLKTETTRAISQSQMASMKNAGVKEYEYVAEAGACKICSGMNKQVLRVHKGMFGQNLPPMHPNCRCSVMPWFDEEAWEKKMREREKARGVKPKEKAVKKQPEFNANDIIEGIKNNSKIKADYAESERLKREFDQRRTRANLDALLEHQQKMMQSNAETVLKELEKHRSFGPKNKIPNSHYTSKGSATTKQTKQAYNYLPTDWVEASIQKGSISPDSTRRGFQFYKDGNSIISVGRISDDFERSYNLRGTPRTALHELVHRMEQVVDGLLEKEKVFYDSRTKGKPSVPLYELAPEGKYHQREKAKDGGFINPYFGKDYNGTAYEVLTMGIDTLFYDPHALLKDKGTMEFVIKTLLEG